MCSLRLSVLIVEDQHRFRKMLATSVAAMGFEVREAGSVEAARMALDPVPHILLCDHHLPGMTGMEFVSELRSAHPDLQAILMSGYATLELAQSALRFDAVDLITKPLQMMHLEQALARAQARVQARQSQGSDRQIPPLSHPKTLREAEYNAIAEALVRCDGNMTRTAAFLGISRRSLYNLTERYGLR